MSGRGWPHAKIWWDLYTFKDLKNQPKSWERSGGNREGQETNKVWHINWFAKFSATLYCRFQILALSWQLGSVVLKLTEEISKTNSTPPWTSLQQRGYQLEDVVGLMWNHWPQAGNQSAVYWVFYPRQIPLDFWARTVWNGRTSPAPGKYSRAPFPSLLFISPHYALGKAYSKSYFMDIKEVTPQREQHNTHYKTRYKGPVFLERPMFVWGGAIRFDSSELKITRRKIKRKAKDMFPSAAIAISVPWKTLFFSFSLNTQNVI